VAIGLPPRVQRYAHGKKKRNFENFNRFEDFEKMCKTLVCGTLNATISYKVIKATSINSDTVPTDEIYRRASSDKTTKKNRFFKKIDFQSFRFENFERFNLFF